MAGIWQEEAVAYFKAPPRLESLRKYRNTIRTTSGLSEIRTRHLHNFTGYCVCELDSRNVVVACYKAPSQR